MPLVRRLKGPQLLTLVALGCVYHDEPEGRAFVMETRSLNINNLRHSHEWDDSMALAAGGCHARLHPE